MRLLAPLLIVFFLVACPSTPEPDPTPPPADGDPAPLASSAKLRGESVVTVEDGPWTVRRTDRSGSMPGAQKPTGAARMRFGGDVEFEESADDSAMAPRESMRGAAEPDSGGEGSTGSPRPVEDPSSDASSDRPFDGDMAATAEKRLSAQGGMPLRAGSTDDNEDFEEFLSFVARWSDREGVADRWDPLDVRERRFIRILDAKDRPVPAARVRLLDESADRVVWDGTTYGDGRIPFYPRVAMPVDETGAVALAPDGGFLIEVSRGEDRIRARWDGADEELVLRLDGERTLPEPIALDVCFVIDTTGSMRDEIARVKATLLRVTERLKSLGREFDLRYGAVLYRDLGDDYVTKAHPFTSDIEAFAAALRKVRADGGGDTPESLNQGLAESVGGLEWRPGAAKVAFLIADAPPHMDYSGDVPYGRSLVAAVARGIRIHAVAASGLDALGSLVFRQVAQFTRGKFIFIEYGSTAESAASHGVGGKVSSNNLDDIVFEQIRDEVARWGR